MNILINGVGGPTPRSIARSLKHHSDLTGIHLFGTDINPLAYGLYETSLYESTRVVPPAGHADYWAVMQACVEDWKIDLALVQPELEVLAWAKKKEQDGLPCKALLPQHHLAVLLTDKARMTDALEGSGMAPPSLVINPDTTDFSAPGDALGYPYWIRATAGSSGLGSLKVENEAALQQWIYINPGVRQFIASRYLPGRNLACKLLYYEGDLVRAACGERVHYIMSKVAPSGITGNTSFGRLLNEPPLVARAREAMDQLFTHTQVPKHGFFTVDFKEDEDGVPFITEVNVRHVAFSVCFAAAGANFSADTVRLLTGDAQMKRDFQEYHFDEPWVFLRDVDAEPVLMPEYRLMQNQTTV